MTTTATATTTVTATAASIPSRDRVEPGSFNIPVGKFPQTASTTAVDADKVATEIIEQLNKALSSKDYQAASSLFLENGYWRDHLCLSWDLHTSKGREKIAAFLKDNSPLARFDIDRCTASRAPHFGPIDGFGDVKGIEFFIKLTTEVGVGEGVARLAEDNREWKFFTFFTSLRELKGYAELVNHHRPKGAHHGAKTGRTNWQDRRIAEMEFENKDPAVMIIGMKFPCTQLVKSETNC